MGDKLANTNGEKKMLNEWLERIELKLDRVIKSNDQKCWHSSAIKGLIGILVTLSILTLAHVITGAN